MSFWKKLFGSGSETNPQEKQGSMSSTNKESKIQEAVRETLDGVEQRIIFDGFTPSKGANLEHDKGVMNSAFNEAFNWSRYRSRLKDVGTVQIIENGKTFMLHVEFVGSLEQSIEFQADVDRVFKKHGLRTDVAEQRRIALFEAAGSGDLVKAQALLKGNPDLVFSKGNLGCTPLHRAVKQRHKDVAELLLASKADVNAKTNNSFTPLLLAVQNGHKDVAELLLASKADISAKTNDGRTPLHVAAEKGHKHLAALLLASHADVNAKANDGWTPLFVAVRHGYEDVAQVLRQHGGHE